VSESHKELIRLFYQGLSSGDLGVIDETLSEDFVEHEEFPGLPPTKAGVRLLFQGLIAAFDGPTIVAEDVIAEGDKVLARARLTGTHVGEFLGIPASGNKVDIALWDLLLVKDGKFVEHWGLLDGATLMQQITGAA
jgi:ketosteroid isomerase-like protein